MEFNKTTSEQENRGFQLYVKPECYTTVAWRVFLTPKQNFWIGMSYSAAVIPAIFLNLVLCYSLHKTKQLGKKSKRLVFALSVSDVIAGLVSIPGSVILFAVYGDTRLCWFEQALMFFGQTNGHFSFYIIMLIAIQKYFGVKPMKNILQSRITKAVFSSKGTIPLVSVTLILSVFHGLVSVYFFNRVTSAVPNILAMVIRILVLIVTYSCYFSLYCSLKRHTRNRQKNMHKEIDRVSLAGAKPARVDKNYSEFFKTVYLVLVIFAVSFLPVLVTDLWTGFYTFRKTYAPQIARFLYFLAHSTYFFNCALNAAVFLYRDPLALAFAKRKLRCNFLQENNVQLQRQSDRASDVLQKSQTLDTSHSINKHGRIG